MHLSVVAGRVFGIALILVVSLGICGESIAGAGGISVVSVDPAQNSLASADTPITVRFDRAVDPSSVICDESFWVFARWSGMLSGDVVFSEGGTAMTLVPERGLSAGELVTVFLSHDIRGEDGTALRDGGYSCQFTVEAGVATRTFTHTQTRTTNGVGESSRPYGGIASDLNNDGYMDVCVVNEDTADLRVLLNGADCSGTFDAFLTPTAAVNDRASPSEPADFDRDGNIDICVVNINTNSVSILLGNGDGTFTSQQEISVGNTPRGIAVLDVDGDGDTDVVNTNSTSGNLSLLLNDGSGVFGPAAFFDGAVTGEWALGSADMDGDGILDLIVGGRSSETIAVLTGDGDGTFTILSQHSAGGALWMLVPGDVNGDGHVDVSTANSSDNDGSILLNSGTGSLQSPTTYPSDSFPLATDLGDIDGDGDMDWILSCFGGDWWVYRNNGSGVFTFDQEILAPAAASCSLVVDIDNDGDCDLVMIDELADTVDFYRNDDDGADCNGNSTPDACDLASGFAQDCNGNGIPDSCDIAGGFSEDGNANDIPDECETAVAACAIGAVDAGCGGAVDVLRLNGSTGGVPRTVVVGTATALSLTISEPPVRRCDGDTTAACVYAWVGTPATSDIVPLPRGLGDMCYGPLILATQAPNTTWNALGKVNKLGADDAPGPQPVIPDSGCFELLSLAGGFGSPLVVTFQGLVEDACTQGTVALSVTNGLTVVIE